MSKIDECKLEKIQGGFSALAAVAIVSAVIFISSFIEGIVFPRSCNNE